MRIKCERQWETQRLGKGERFCEKDTEVKIRERLSDSEKEREIESDIERERETVRKKDR